MANNNTQQLQKVFTIQKEIQDIHPFLEKIFPIVIAKDGFFHIYDQEDHKESYQLVKEVAAPMPIPDGVRAAFPLEEYEKRMACVVTDDVFEESGGYATIFHEFVHCQQYETCELDLKATLTIAQEAKVNNDGMWEINYPFPYTNPEFVRLYEVFLSTDSDIHAIRQQLKVILPHKDYEYMVWQQWKEGFARWMENKIRARLNLPHVVGKTKPPFTRVDFYTGGEKLIQTLINENPELHLDLKALFTQMLNGTAN